MATGRRAGASATSEPAAQTPTLALVLIAAVTVLWGLNWPAMRMAVLELSPWTFRVFCVTVSGGGLLLLARLSGERIRPPPRVWPWLLLLAAFSVTAWQMLSAFALERIGGGHAAIVAYTMPIWAAMMSAAWLGERPSPRLLLALALGMAAVLLLVLPDLGRLGAAPLGTLLMIAAAVAWAAATVITKAVQWRIGLLALSGWQLVIGGVPILLAWLWLEPVPDLSRLTWRGALGAGYAATVALIFCFTAYIKIVTLLPATVAALSTLAIPVVGLLSAAWLLGEPIGLGQIGALLLVTAALTLALMPRRQPA
jgi:drug/metabolite transporter (DMT)-like permease